MDVFGPILEIFKRIGPPLPQCIKYHRKLDEYEEKLREALDDLNNRKKDIELSLRTECDKGKLPKKEVEHWLENIEGITSDARNIELDAIKKGKFFLRARLRELVDKKIQEVKDYYEKSSSFHTLAIDAPPAGGTMLLTEELAGQTTTMDEIWGYLMGNEVNKIGVCGMGGAGKTTLMMHINNRLLKEAIGKFDNIIWVTVSQTVDVIELQKKIATALDQQYLPETEDKIRRAGMLLDMLQKKRFVLILDDVWETIQLEELGVPEQDKCKLVLTTRSMDVCHSMGCKPVIVKPLPDNEALKLFLDRVGHDILQVPTLKEIVESIVAQCAGLPLAIVTISGSMKGVHEVPEWRNALNELSNNIKSVKGGDDVIFERLKFSYDRLNDNKIQRCFLYCALYPCDYDIPKDELVDSWINEGLIDEMDNVQDAEDKAHSILSRLSNTCLLLESRSEDYFGRATVKVHDVVRDMVLTYITSRSPMFMVKAGLKLEELPNEQEWKENVEKVSLMNNQIEEISSDASPNCPKLSTLLLQGNPLERISEPFFMHMKELKILNLSKTKIKSLPNSISDLTNLTALLLAGCKYIKNVPSLSKLLALKNLNLRGTNIENVPEGFEVLTNLRNLDLDSSSLGELPIGVLPKFCCLQKFRIYWGSKTLQATVMEAAGLKKLDTFVACFENLQDFQLYIKCLKVHNQVPNKYYIVTAPSGNFENRYEIMDYMLSNFDKCIVLVDYNICEREDSILLLEDVQFLGLSACNDVTSTSDIPSFNTLERLEVLHLQSLLNLTVLFEISNVPLFPYSNLKSLRIYECDKLKNLFSSKLLPELIKLEEIYVEFCKGMEEIITLMNVDDKEEEKELSLPKLRILSLKYNSNLKRVCGSHGMMVCDSLQEVEIWGCSHLISRLPFRLPTDENGRPTPPPALKKIEVEREWWEALDPNSQTLLLPFCKFIRSSFSLSDSE